MCILNKYPTCCFCSKDLTCENHHLKTFLVTGDKCFHSLVLEMPMLHRNVIWDLWLMIPSKEHINPLWVLDVYQTRVHPNIAHCLSHWAGLRSSSQVLPPLGVRLRRGHRPVSAPWSSAPWAPVPLLRAVPLTSPGLDLGLWGSHPGSQQIFCTNLVWFISFQYVFQVLDAHCPLRSWHAFPGLSLLLSFSQPSLASHWYLSPPLHFPPLHFFLSTHFLRTCMCLF